VNRLISIIKWMINRINSLCIILGSIVVILMMLGISIAALSRYLFGHALGWVDDFSAFGMVFMAFLGAGEVLRRHGHVNIDLFVNMLSRRNRSITGIATSVAGMAVSLLLVWYGTLDTVVSYQEKAMTNSVYPIPEVLLFWVIPLGGLLLAAGFMRDVRNGFRLLKCRDEVED